MKEGHEEGRYFCSISLSKVQIFPIFLNMFYTKKGINTFHSTLVNFSQGLLSCGHFAIFLYSLEIFGVKLNSFAFTGSSDNFAFFDGGFGTEAGGSGSFKYLDKSSLNCLGM